MTNSESDVATQRGPFSSFLWCSTARETIGFVSGLLVPVGK